MSEDIMKMLDHINGADYNKANQILADLLAQKQGDALDQEKVALAQAMWSPEDEDEEDLADETTEVDEDDIEISDEELEDQAEELYDEDDEGEADED